MLTQSSITPVSMIHLVASDWRLCALLRCSWPRRCSALGSCKQMDQELLPHPQNTQAAGDTSPLRVSSDPSPLRRLDRADTLDRFAVLQMQYQQLVAQLRPLAKHYMAYPKVCLRSASPCGLRDGAQVQIGCAGEGKGVS